MALKQCSIDFHQISKDRFLRNDMKYHNFQLSTGWNIFGIFNKELIKLRDILVEDYKIFDYEEDTEYKGIPTGQSYLDEDGDIIDYQLVTKEEHPGRLKYRVDNDNILISSLRLAKSPSLYFPKLNLKEYVFSNGFYIFKVKEDWNIKFISYLLRSPKIKNVLDNNIYRGIGISAYRAEDLLSVKIPKISLAEQEQAIKKIEPIENIIKEIKRKIKPDKEIINNVFAREFNFDFNTFEKLKKIKYYDAELFSFSDNKDLRNSVRFHRKAGAFVMEELKGITSKRIKDFISEPIVLGASISPSDFDANGDYYYISMATVKNLKLELDDTQLISSDYVRENASKTIQKNDIIMTRSGVAIGKFALVEDEDILGIFADFTMRIRLKNYNHLFAYYYFRTDYFQYLIEVNKKGLQNQNIFPSMIQEFPLIDISLEEQQRIVEEIKKELDKQEQLRKKIVKQREKINDIIENALTTGV